MPEPKDVHVDRILTRMSLKYHNEDLIWDQLLPEMKVKERSDLYYIYNRAEHFRIPDDKIGPKSNANETDFTVTTGNYSVIDHSLAEFVSKEEEDAADSPLAPRSDATEFVTDLLLLAQEKRVATLLNTTATYPAANRVVLSGTDQWNDETNSTPDTDILTALDATFVRPNVISLGRLVFSQLRKHPRIVNGVKAIAGASITGGLVSLGELAQYFEVDKVIVGRAKENTAKEGQTEAIVDIWGKHCQLLHVKKALSIRTVTFGSTFLKMNLMTQVISQPARGVTGGNLIKVGWNTDEKIIASDLGYFIEDAIA